MFTIPNLDSASEFEKQKCYEAACKYYEIPPELNLLAFGWVDNGAGERHLTLYAKKGATDRLRDRLGISVTRTTREDIPGAVVWVVEGKDKQDRFEQAVGAISIAGLVGKALENAIMVGHTRAVKRLTLQFAGGGILDETEVGSSVVDINRSEAPLSTLSTVEPIIPEVQINADPGLDVTEKKERHHPKRTTKQVIQEMREEPDALALLNAVQTETHDDAQQAPTTTPEYPTEDQKKAWRAEMFKYTNDVDGYLKCAGMTDINRKIKKYVMHLIPNVQMEKNKVNLTIQQQQQVLDRFKEVMEMGGPKLLAEEIEVHGN